jgi:predicted nucleic acid-binding Zn ribbon protein
MDDLTESRFNDKDELEHLKRVIQQRSRRPREPRRIADVINQLLARRGYAQGQATEQLEKAWSEAVGGHLARHSRPATLKRGVLEIIVRSSTVLQELTFQKKQLLGRLRSSDAGAAIRDLRFHVGQLD